MSKTQLLIQDFDAELKRKAKIVAAQNESSLKLLVTEAVLLFCAINAINKELLKAVQDSKLTLAEYISEAIREKLQQQN